MHSSDKTEKMLQRGMIEGMNKKQESHEILALRKRRGIENITKEIGNKLIFIIVVK